jgi:hypothetical protein
MQLRLGRGGLRIGGWSGDSVNFSVWVTDRPRRAAAPQKLTIPANLSNAGHKWICTVSDPVIKNRFRRQQ